jgi:hypothetical protein
MIVRFQNVVKKITAKQLRMGNYTNMVIKWAYVAACFGRKLFIPALHGGFPA